MKKETIICIIIATGGFTAHAQTVTAMTQQLAVLHNLQQSLQKGYSLVNHGLQNIGDHNDGEFQQHERYFKSLSTINPNIFSPSKPTYAQNDDNPQSKLADSDGQVPDGRRSH